MQTLKEIRELLASIGREPTKRFGQNFLIDPNLMAKVVELAEVDADQVVLEVGPGTGSLTEELAARAQRVVAVEIDTFLAELLAQRLAGRGNVRIVCTDALAGKHQLAPELLAALAPENRAHLVSNLPYNVAVPIIINCLSASWHAHRRGEGVFFPRLTFTVQRELADRLTAGVGSEMYGPVSVQVALLSRAMPGKLLPAEAFWPRPQVQSRMVRLDFDESQAQTVEDLPTLAELLAVTFQHRRKRIATAIQRRDCPFDERGFLAGLEAAGVDPLQRPEQIAPADFARLANALRGAHKTQ